VKLAECQLPPTPTPGSWMVELNSDAYRLQTGIERRGRWMMLTASEGVRRLPRPLG
jgi:hypothetical protein